MKLGKDQEGEMGRSKTEALIQAVGSHEAVPRTLPHRSHLQRKTWGPGAAASGGICRSPARRRARPGGGAGSAPPPRRLPPPSLPFLRPRAPSSSLLLLLHPSPTLFVCPSRCDWLGGSAAPAPRGRRGHQPRRPPEAAEGNEIRGPEAALHPARARGGCLCTPSRGPRGLASSRGGGASWPPAASALSLPEPSEARPRPPSSAPG
nr:gametogenetin-like [Camelus dromedarius]